MRSDPLVSVCIPSFNHAVFLGAAVESVLGQSYRNVELVVADDGSSDGSLELAMAYADRYPDRVRVCTHPGGAHRGISATANLAFRESRGEYWCGLSSDDLFYPDKVERQVAVMERRREIGLVYGSATVVDESGRPIRNAKVVDLSRQVDPLAGLIQSNCIFGQTVMVRRECFDRVGLHDEELIYSDWELWIRIVAHYGVAFLPRPLAFYRIHSRNTSVGVAPAVQLDRAAAVMRALQRKALTVGGGLSRPFIQALVQLQLAYYAFCGGEHGEARDRMRAAHRIDSRVFRDVPFLAGWLARRQCELETYARGGVRNFISWFGRAAADARIVDTCMRRLRLASALGSGAALYVAMTGLRILWRHARSFMPRPRP